MKNVCPGSAPRPASEPVSRASLPTVGGEQGSPFVGAAA
jgi:hypothetical protein